MRNWSAAGCQEIRQGSVNLSLVNKAKPLLNDVALSIDQHVLRTGYNVELLAGSEGGFVVNVQVNEIDLAGVLVFEPMHDRLIASASHSPIGVGIEKLRATGLRHYSRVAWHTWTVGCFKCCGRTTNGNQHQ